MIFTKENILTMLKDGVITVTFTKIDGSERVMKCTLMSEYVPNTGNSASNQVLLQESGNDNNVSVWDVESNGWRSFRIGSVKSVSVG
jgi:hypothetical protein